MTQREWKREKRMKHGKVYLLTKNTGNNMLRPPPDCKNTNINLPGFYIFTLNLIAMPKKAIFLSLIFLVHFAIAQQKQIDSLKHLLNTTQVDTLKTGYNYSLSRLYRDKPDSALFYINNGMRLASSMNDHHGIAYGKYAYGLNYGNQGNYPLAIKNELEALQLSIDLNMPALTAYCYRGLAAIYDDQKDDKKSVYYIQLAIPIAKKIGDQQSLVSLYNFISYFYNRLDQPGMALKYDNLANELAETLHDDRLSGFVYASMGKTYLKLKKPDIGLPFLYKAITLLKKTQDRTWLQNCYTYISDYYMTTGQADSAMIYTEKALTEAKATTYKAGILDAMKKLGALNDGHDQVKATWYYKNALALNEQLFDSEKTRDFQNLIVADDQRQKELAEQKRIAEEERKENLQLVAIALFIPIFLMVVFFLSRTKLHRGLIDFMGVLSLLLAFEFITLLLHPLIEQVTHHAPVLELIILVVIAAVLVPLHHQLTHWLKEKLSRRVHEQVKEVADDDR
jgi:tetratricopeptide (TPR) repeat protein